MNLVSTLRNLHLTLCSLQTVANPAGGQFFLHAVLALCHTKVGADISDTAMISMCLFVSYRFTVRNSNADNAQDQCAIGQSAPCRGVLSRFARTERRAKKQKMQMCLKNLAPLRLGSRMGWSRARRMRYNCAFVSRASKLCINLFSFD